MKFLKAVLAFVRGLWTKEPAVIISSIVAAVVAVAAALGIVVDEQSVASIVATVLGILFGGVAVRSKVTPV